MAQFSYVATNKEGARVKGVIDAPNEAEVRVLLRAQSLRPVRITKSGALDVDIMKLPMFSRVSNDDIILFTRQLSILLSSGVPLVQGLEVIAQQMQNAAMKRICLAIKEKVTGGSFLWEAMKSYNEVFSDLYVSMVRAGESAGALDTILKRLIKYLDDANRLKKLVRGAMVYPIAVVLVGIAVVMVMLIWVIPKFEELLVSSGQELPMPTQVVIDASHFAQENFLYMIGGSAVGFYLLKRYLKTPEGRAFFDHIVMKVPTFGPIILKVAVARFARTMQTLLSSGINLLDALDICRDAIGNKSIAEMLGKIRADVEQGKSLAAVMSKISLFPHMVVQMVTVGETTGNLDKMLERAAEFYEEDVQNFVNNISKLIEPFVLVFLGGLVGGLMIAMYLPIFKLAGSAGT